MLELDVGVWMLGFGLGAWDLAGVVEARDSDLSLLGVMGPLFEMFSS